MKLSSQDYESLKVADAEYSVVSEGHQIPQPIVHLFCRDKNREKRQIDVEGFRPYFMMAYDEFVERTTDVINDRHVVAIETDLSTYSDDAGDDVEFDDVDAVETFLNETGSCAVYHRPETFDALDETKLVKVYTVEPEHVGKIRDHWDRTWEADIPFERRFLISSGIKNGIEVPANATSVRYENWDGHSDSDGQVREIRPADPPDVHPRMLVTDIEVATHGGGFPDPIKARNEITAITAYDNYEDEYAGWILESDEWDSDEYDFESEINDSLGMEIDSMSVFDHEGAMIEDYHNWVLERDFDIVTGWNSSDFDYPYIINRSYEVSAYSIRDWDKFGNPGAWYDDRDNTQMNIGGVVTFDMLNAYKKTQYRELRSYALDSVAEAELGMGKEELDGDFDDAWHYDPVDFMVYNVRDVQAVAQIEEESGLIDLYDNMRQVTGALYETCNHNGPMLDTLFLREAYQSGIALPTNTSVPPEEGNYPGAKVFDVKPGVHKNSVYPDLSSLYPSLFQMLNLGTETIIGTEEDLEKSEYSKDDVFRVPNDFRDFKTVPKGEEYSDVDRDEYKGVLSEDGSLREMFDPQYDDLYVLKPDIKESFIRSTINDLIELKYKYTGDRYSAIKRVTNCHTSDTEVLTPNGILHIDELDVGDEVYTYDYDSEEMGIEEVSRTYAYPEYDGEIIRFDNKFMDYAVTPNHEFVARKVYEDSYTEYSAEYLANNSSFHYLPGGWEEIGSDGDIQSFRMSDFVDDLTIHVSVEENNKSFGKYIQYMDSDYNIQYEGSGRKTYKMSVETYEEFVCSDDFPGTVDTVTCSNGTEYARVPYEYDADLLIELMGWYVAEGYTSDKHSSNTKYVRITQGDDENRAHIQSLLDELDIPYSIGEERQFSIHSSVLHEFFSNAFGSTALEKHLPDFVSNFSPEQKQLLFDRMMDGDGSVGETSEYYSTSSKDLRDDVMALLVELGYCPKYTVTEFDEETYSDAYQIWWSGDERGIRGSYATTHESYPDETPDDGVYDVEVPGSHTIIAGRNGKFQVTHQSVYGVAGDSKSGGKGFRLFDKRIAEGITLAGRKTIEHTAEEFTGYINEHYDDDAYLVGGDTDASVTSIPNANDLGDVYDWSTEAVEYVDASYDEFVQDEFDMAPDDDHELEVELESVASALFYMIDEDADNPFDTGVKKRYAQNIVWDDDDGWVDLPDADETQYDVLNDPDNKSDVKDESVVNYETYNTVLRDIEPGDTIEITGFEYVRSDSAIITVEAQERVLTDILLADDVSDRLYTYLSGVRDDIVSGDVPIRKLGRPKGISNPLDEYGWKTVDELRGDTNYSVTEDDIENGGRYVAKSGPTYRGRKYAVDHFPWEDGDQKKCMRLYVDKVRGDVFPAAYEYDDFPRDDRPDPLEVGERVDAITVEYIDRVPDNFVFDREKMMEKELKDKIQPIIRTIGEDWDGIVGRGRQVGLDAF